MSEHAMMLPAGEVVQILDENSDREEAVVTNLGFSFVVVGYAKALTEKNADASLSPGMVAHEKHGLALYALSPEFVGHLQVQDRVHPETHVFLKHPALQKSVASTSTAKAEK